MLNGWHISNILRVGKSANNFDLPTNCYYCTAAALQNTNCSDLVADRQIMQGDTGSAQDFAELFAGGVQHKEFNYLQEVKNLLLIHLPTHNAVAFGYNRVDGTGHMIVVYKAEHLVDGQGDVTQPAWGNLRYIDYQKQNPQPEDGLLPISEREANMTRYHVFHL